MYRKIIAGLLSISCFIGSFGAAAVNAAETNPECSDKAKNVIYIIGEGMGQNLIQYAQWKYVGAASNLNMQQMSVSGLVSTYSADSGTSDDASAGTQLATGSGTDNGVIGMGAELDGYRGYTNLLEAAQESGKRTGIISDSELTGSVAAAFLAHSESEDNEDIKTQVENAEPDVKISNSTSLAADTTAAIDGLNNDDGFVLVIDSAKIEDYAAANDSVNAMSAVKTLDDTVKAALDFAEEDGETLVIVTAEHETGSVVETDLSSRSSGSDTITWLSTKPSNTNVLLFAEGRGAEHFNGYYHSTDICRKIAHIAGITDWDFYDVKTLFETAEATEPPETEELEILSYDFEDAEDGTTVVEDKTNDNDAALIGGAEIVYDDALGSNVLKLDNKSTTGSYLEFPRGVLDKMQYLTIEMNVKSDQTYDKNSSLFQLGASTSAYFYFKYEPLGEGIRYSLNPGSEWKSSGSQTMTGIGGDNWVKLRYVVEPTRHTVYIDDEVFLTYETKGSIPMLGDNLYAYIGHSMFSNDKDYSGFVDNIKISGKKLDESFEDEIKIKTGVDVEEAELVTDENDLPEKSASGEAKNVIILIGDGTGQNIMQLSQWRYNGAENPYYVQTMPYIGLSKTYSASAGVTDSAAGGTAISSGRKTINDYVGVGGAGVRFKSIMEYAHENGMATGILSTTDLTDATPAAFSAHALTRASRDLIASQQAVCGTDIFMGGGGERYSSYLSAMQSDGYKYITTAAQMNELGNNDKVIGLFGTSGDLVQPLDGDTTEPLLDEMVKKSIEMLDGRSENGFVLMAEGATIDHYNHSNAIDGAVEQAKIFDNAIKEALDFAKKDGNTLVVVSADHETGGLGILANSSVEAGAPLSGKYEYTTGNHSSAYVPIYAYGPGAEKLTGVHENTEIFDVAMGVLGMEKDELPKSDKPNQLILDLDFDNDDLTANHGSAEERGTLTYSDGHNGGRAVQFDGDANNYIELFDDNGDSLLAGVETMTVSYWSKTSSSNSTNWMFYAAPGTDVQKSSAELYIGSLDKGSSLTIERYFYSRPTGASASFTGDEWKHVAIVLDTNKTMLYINGELKSTVDSAYPVQDILDFNPIAYIGRANWSSSGESAVGLVDDYKIHNYCLSGDQIKMLYTDGYIPEDLENELSVMYMGDQIDYTMSVRDTDNTDVYIALYNSGGLLAGVKKCDVTSIVKGSFANLDDNESYVIGAYIWEKDTMAPVWSSKQTIEQYSLIDALEGSRSGGGSAETDLEDDECEFTVLNGILQLK